MLPSYQPQARPAADRPVSAARMPPLIPDRGEFIDALSRLRRGELLVHADDSADERCLIEGQVFWTSFKPLSDFGLLDALPQDPRDSRMACFRLSPSGRDFAERACLAWRQRPLWQRLLVRLAG